MGSWVAISFPLPLMGSVHTLPHTPANLERNVHQYRKKYGYLYIKTGIDACLCKDMCVPCEGIWGV